MFDTLDRQIRKDRIKETSARERTLEYALILVLPVILFTALYFAIHLMTD
jgi:hypothetical protein